MSNQMCFLFLPVWEKFIAIRTDGQACYKVRVTCESQVFNSVFIIHAQIPSADMMWFDVMHTAIEKEGELDRFNNTIKEMNTMCR